MNVGGGLEFQPKSKPKAVLGLHLSKIYWYRSKVQLGENGKPKKNCLVKMSIPKTSNGNSHVVTFAKIMLILSKGFIKMWRLKKPQKHSKQTITNRGHDSV